jgi:hypothetical protein
MVPDKRISEEVFERKILRNHEPNEKKIYSKKKK